MRFISFAVAMLCVSAESNLANQLTSLRSMVQSTSEWDTNNMIDVISARKTELDDALKAKTMSKDEVAGELKYLLELVRDVEANDKTHAVTTLSARKDNLVNMWIDLGHPYMVYIQDNADCASTDRTEVFGLQILSRPGHGIAKTCTILTALPMPL